MQPNDPTQPTPPQDPNNQPNQQWPQQQPITQTPSQPAQDQNNFPTQAQPTYQQPNDPGLAQQTAHQPNIAAQPQYPQTPQTVFAGNQAMPPQQQMPGQQPVGYPAGAVHAMGEGDKSFIGTFILSWLLGTFGADRFYVEKIGTAIFKLLTLGGFGIWATLDLILIGFGKFKDKQGRQLQGYEKNKGWARIVAIFLLVINFVGIIILSALVITTFSGLQRKAADSERQSDITALHLGIESYFQQNKRYPSLSELNDSTFRETQLPTLSPQNFTDPKGTTDQLSLNDSRTYRYSPLSATGGDCENPSTTCTSYNLTAELDGGGSYAKTSMN